MSLVCDGDKVSKAFESLHEFCLRMKNWSRTTNKGDRQRIIVKCIETLSCTDTHSTRSHNLSGYELRRSKSNYTVGGFSFAALMRWKLNRTIKSNAHETLWSFDWNVLRAILFWAKVFPCYNVCLERAQCSLCSIYNMCWFYLLNKQNVWLWVVVEMWRVTGSEGQERR